MTLHDLPAGSSAVVTGLTVSGANGVRLMELGFVPGTAVRVLLAGTPALIGLHGGRMTLSHELARAVTVESR